MIDARDGLELKVGRGKVVDDLADALAQRAGDGDQRFIGRSLVRENGDIGDRAEHFDASDLRAPLGALVVDEADYFHPELRTMLDLAGQRLAGVAGADDQDPFPCLHRRFRGAEAIAPDADQHPRSEQRQQREGPVGQEHAAR